MSFENITPHEKVKKKKKKTKDEYSPKIESTDDANDGNETAYLKFFQENIVVLKI